MRHDYTIQYKNILLSPLKKADIESLRLWRNKPENCVFLRKITHITPKMQETWYQNYIHNPDELIWGIYETDQLKRLVGSLALYNFQHQTAEFGKILIGDCQAHGKHIGLNAVKACLAIGFNELGLQRIVLRVYEENQPAMRVYLQAGFQLNATRRFVEKRIERDMEITRQLWLAAHGHAL